MVCRCGSTQWVGVDQVGMSGTEKKKLGEPPKIKKKKKLVTYLKRGRVAMKSAT